LYVITWIEYNYSIGKDMVLSSWLFAVSVFILILAIVIGIGWWYRNRSILTPEPPNPYNSPIVWGTPIPGPNNNKNSCQLYTIPTIITQGSPQTLIPGTPTYNASILDNLTGNKEYPKCLDSDQILAQQLKHTCIAPNGVVDGAITRCLLLEGGNTGIGGSETFYSDEKCARSHLPKACPGVLSFVSVNYQVPNNNAFRCILYDGLGASVLMEPCDPPVDINNQLFRVTRIDPGQNPQSLEPGQGQNGLIAQIYHRDSGLCLVAGTGSTSTTYDGSYVGCPDYTRVFTGPDVIMGECTGGVYPGYLWLMLPSIEYCGVTGGCPGCVGSSCFRCERSNECNAQCSGYESMITPPQIVYLGNLDITQIPLGSTGYAGLTGPSAVIKWLVDNNAQSLYNGGSDNQLILLPIGLDTAISTDICSGSTESSCETGDRAYAAQYINTTLYNTISNLAVCFNENNQSCVNL